MDRIWFSCKYMIQSLGDFISRPNHTVVYGWKVWAGWLHIFMPNIVSVMVTILWQLSPGPIITSGRCWPGWLGTSRDYLLTTAIMRGHCPLPRPPTPFILNIIIWTVNILHWTMWRTATTTMSISDVVMLTMDHLIWNNTDSISHLHLSATILMGVTAAVRAGRECLYKLSPLPLFLFSLARTIVSTVHSGSWSRLGMEWRSMYWNDCKKLISSVPGDASFAADHQQTLGALVDGWGWGQAETHHAAWRGPGEFGEWIHVYCLQ